MERKHGCTERGFSVGDCSRWRSDLGYRQEEAEVGHGSRWRVHLRAGGNARYVGVRSYSAYDQSSGRLDLARHVLPATSHDVMDGDFERDDFLGTFGHDSLTSPCTFAFSIGRKVVAVAADNGPSITPVVERDKDKST